MSQLINKAIFKYILLLLLTFIISVSVVISVHFFFHSRTTDINAQSKNLEAKMEIARYLLEDIKSIHISFLELSASESNPYTRQKKIDTLRAQIQRCEHTLSLLQKGGTFTKQFSPTSSLNLHYTKDTSFSLEPSIQNDLSAIYNAIDAISKLLNQRDSYLSTNDKTLKGTSEIIRNFNNNLNYIFSLLIESIEKTTLEDHQKLAEFESKIKTEQHQNHLLEIFILCLTTFTILLVIYRILEQILNLYKTLEKQLYYVF